MGTYLHNRAVVKGVLPCFLWLVACAAIGSAQAPPLREPTDGFDGFDTGIPEMSRNAPAVENWDVPHDTPATLDGGATLNSVLLSAIRDNTIGLEYADRPAYFYGLWLSQQVEASTLADFARAFRDERQRGHARYAERPRSEFPQFEDVFQNPVVYRGRPVTLHGRLRKLIKYDAGKNDLGIGEVYEGWIFTEDSQNNPAVVVFTSKPQGLALGGDITEEVRLTGYFLKMYGYDAQDTARRAPMFVAHSVDWFPSKAAVARTPISFWTYLLTTVLCILGVWGIWLLTVRGENRSHFRTHGRNFDDYPPQEFLGELESRTVEPHH